MDAKQFLADFKHIVNAPSGVERIREMVLDLAVHGQLLPQVLTDRPANDLIERIRHKKSRLLKEKKIAKQPKFAKIDSSNIPFKAPEGWVFIRIGEVVSKIGSGSTPRGGKKAYVKKGIPFLRSQNIWNDGVRLNDVAFISEEIHSKMANTVVLSSDILLNITGASLGRCALVPQNLKEANVSQHVSIIRPTFKETREFLHLLIISPYSQRMIWGRQVGMAREGLSKKVLEQFEIPIPPVEEQKRIVAKVNELMALCNKLEEQQLERHKLQSRTHATVLSSLVNAKSDNTLKVSWLRVQKNFALLMDGPKDVEHLNGCIKDLAIKGVLTKQDIYLDDANDEFQLIRKRAEELRKKKKIRKTRKINLDDSFQEPFSIPKGWRWVTLDQICYQITDGTHFTPQYTTRGIPFISVKDLTNGKIDFSNTKFISEEAHAELKKRCNPEKHDLLLTKVGTTGIPRIVNTDREFSLFVSVALLKFPYDHINPEFFEMLMSSPFVKRQSIEGTQGIGNKNLVLKTIRGFCLPLPPLTEQLEIVDKVNTIVNITYKLGRLLEESNFTADRLSKSATSAITGTSIKDNERMKPPKTELMTKLKLKTSPNKNALAPLATILAKHNGELSAKGLWNYSGLEIDGFYQQLKNEMSRGWIDEPEKARVVEKADANAAEA